MNNATGRIDFHLHSYASNVTDYYAANAFAIPESYSDPLKLYRLLKQRGMTLVTLTDHNSIDGALEMLDAGLAGRLHQRRDDDDVSGGWLQHPRHDRQHDRSAVRRGRTAAQEHLRDDRLRRRADRGEDRNRAGNKLAYFMTHPLMSTQNRPYGQRGLARRSSTSRRRSCSATAFEVQNGARTRR